MTTTDHEQKQKPAQGAPSKACALFSLGRVVATPGAVDLLEAVGVFYVNLLARHVRGDFGNLSDHDRQANEAAIREGARILSSYDYPAGSVWIITEWDRSATTILLPSDY